MFLLIKNAHVFSPKDIGVTDVLICDDKIIRIEENLSFEWKSEDIKIVDAQGKYLVPGFIDQHVHIIGGGGEDGYASLIPQLQMTDCIRYGVTTVVGLLGTDGIVKSVEALVAKTKALKESGMSAYCLTGSYAYPSTTITGSVAKDIVFIEEILGVKIAISDHRSSNISKDDLAYLATQARTAGLLAHKPGMVVMHTGRGKKGLKDVMAIVEETDIPISQFRPTHCGNQLEDALQFGRMGGYIDFTSDLDPAPVAEKLAEAWKNVDHKLITLSSDSNGSFPKWSKDNKLIGMGIGKAETLYNTIRYLIQHPELGIPMEEALEIITCNVAAALGIERKKGQISEGMDADLVLLNSDYSIDGVIALGKVMMIEQELQTKNYYDDIR